MRFFKDRLYVFKGQTYGYISGGARAMVPYEKVVLGKFIDTRACKSDCVGEFQADTRTYRVEDGHLPDYEPRVSGQELVRVMKSNLYPTATPL